MTSQALEPPDVHPADDPRRIVRFGAFELDTQTEELFRDGVKVKLQGQPYRLLLLLVQNPGEIITRERLQQELWPGEFVEFDQSLNAAVRKLRTALGDTAENPRFVETLARRGYRFIAPVTWPSSSVTPRRTSRGRLLPIVAAAIAVAAIAALGYWQWQRSRSPWLNVIAVLPFSADKANEPIADGLSETLIDDISNLPNLRVMAGTTSFRYRGATDLQRIARDLNVEAVITGTIHHTANQYLVHVEIVHGDDGTQIWGNEFRARDSDLPAMQSEITHALSVRLQRGLRGTPPSTKSADAYDLYLRGLAEWNHRDHASLERALDLFNRAIAIDPTFARAYAGVANVYGVMVGSGQILPETGVPKILAAAQRALELDPSNAEAMTSIATTKYRNLWDFPGAERDYRRAIAANPNYPTAHQWYADYLRSFGRRAEARRENEIAYKLDPFSKSTVATQCWALYYDRQYDQAIAFYRNNPYPASEYAHACAVRAMFEKGDNDAAIREIESSKFDARGTLNFVNAYRTGGKRGYLTAFLNALLQMPDAATAHPVEIAEAYANLGDKDKAFAWLERAYQHRISRLTSITFEPGFDPLRSDPRYADLVKRIGLPL